MSVRQVIIGGNRIGIMDLDEIFIRIRNMELSDDAELKTKLFEMVKAKNHVHPNFETVYKEDLFAEYKVFTGELAGDSRKKVTTEIRVYGPGCPRCGKLDRIIKEILASKKACVDYRYITDIQEMTAKGIAVTPALAIDDEIVFAGRVPTRQELEQILDEALEGI